MTQTTVQDIQALADTATVMAAAPPLVITLKDGTDVTVFKCKPSNLGSVLNLIVVAMKSSGISQLGQAPDLLRDPVNLLQLIANLTEPLFKTCAEMCSLRYDTLVDLELDDAVKVVRGVAEVNIHFFTENVLPLVRSLLPEMAGAGSTEAAQS